MTKLNWLPPIWRNYMATVSVLQMLLFPIDSVGTSERILIKLTRDVCRSVVEEIFGVLAPTKFGVPKLTIFDNFATQQQILGPISPARNMIETVGKQS